MAQVNQFGILKVAIANHATPLVIQRITTLYGYSPKAQDDVETGFELVNSLESRRIITEYNVSDFREKVAMLVGAEPLVYFLDRYMKGTLTSTKLPEGFYKDDPCVIELPPDLSNSINRLKRTDPTEAEKIIKNMKKKAFGYGYKKLVY